MVATNLDEEQPQKINNDAPEEENPKETFWLIYITFFVLGIVQILPWSFFLNANEYWMYKFRNTTIDNASAKDRTDLQAQFAAALVTCLQVATVSSVFLTMLFGHKIKVRTRILGTLSVVLFLMIICTIFTKVDTDNWQAAFYIFTLATLAIVTAMDSAMGFSFYTIASCFPAKYLGAYVNGQGLSAIFAASLQLASIAIGLSKDNTALVYFTCGSFAIAFAIVLFAFTCTHPFFADTMQKHHDSKKDELITWRETMIIFKKIWPAMTVLFFWLSTFAPLNSMFSLIASENEDSVWGTRYFVAVGTYFIGAVINLIGRAIGTRYPNIMNHYSLILLCAVRVFVFIPLIMFCNAQPRHHLTVLFPHDYQYIIISIAYWISDGIVVALLNLLIPTLVEMHERKYAFQIYMSGIGMLGVLMGLLGNVVVRLL